MSGPASDVASDVTIDVGRTRREVAKSMHHAERVKRQTFNLKTRYVSSIRIKLNLILLEIFVLEYKLVVFWHWGKNPVILLM